MVMLQGVVAGAYAAVCTTHSLHLTLDADVSCPISVCLQELRLSGSFLLALQARAQLQARVAQLQAAAAAADTRHQALSAEISALRLKMQQCQELVAARSQELEQVQQQALKDRGALLAVVLLSVRISGASCTYVPHV